MIKSMLAATAALLVLSATATAQVPVTLKGTIEPLTATACDPSATHKIRCTDVLLKSSVVDLTALEGRTVDITGQLGLRFDCRSIDVQTAEVASVRTLQIAIGGTRIGRSVTLTSFTPPGGLIAYVWSGSSGFLPLGRFGTLLIGLQDASVVGTKVSIGIDIRTETIPNDPNLVGVDLHYQFGYASVLGGLEFGFLNPGCFEIQR